MPITQDRHLAVLDAAQRILATLTDSRAHLLAALEAHYAGSLPAETCIDTIRAYLYAAASAPLTADVALLASESAATRQRYARNVRHARHMRRKRERATTGHASEPPAD